MCHVAELKSTDKKGIYFYYPGLGLLKVGNL